MASKDWLLDSDRNIFLTGKAGTGKSYRIDMLTKKCEEEGKNIILSAPTGTAAVNIGGDTCHSIFGIPVPCTGLSLPPTKDRNFANKIKVISKADVIVIDEISMLRNDAFVYIIKAIKRAEKLKGSKIRLILAGDFCQIPPVIQKKEVAALKKAGLDESGYAFTTKEWKSLNLKVVELKKIYRQQDGSVFAENLGKIRDCDESCISYFWDFVKKDYEVQDEDIQICGTNAEVDEINRTYMDSLPGAPSAYESIKKGRGLLGVIPDVVLLKVGARVMFTVNDSKRRYFNGLMGKVTELGGDYVIVEVTEGGKTNRLKIERHEYKSYSYSIAGGKLQKSEIGNTKQIPLKVAKAITIHKSQGKTFERAVIAPKVFAPGQLYVALSRVKEPSGLVLTEEITKDCFKENYIVSDFIENGYKYDLPKVKKSASVGKKKTTTQKKVIKKKAATKKKVANKKVVKKSATRQAAKKTASKKKIAVKKAASTKATTKKPKKTLSKPKTKAKNKTTKAK